MYSSKMIAFILTPLIFIKILNNPNVYTQTKVTNSEIIKDNNDIHTQTLNEQVKTTLFDLLHFVECKRSVPWAFFVNAKIFL